MKNKTQSLFGAVAIIITVFALVPVSSVSARNFEKDLRFGIKNDDVAELQKKLQEEGFFDHNILITGNFMELTKEAVVKFQKAHGIPATGFVGELTRKELNNVQAEKVVRESAVQAQSDVQTFGADAAKKIEELTAKIKELEEKIRNLTAFGQTEPKPASITAEMQAKAGVIITGGVSGPGYPTGPLNVTVPAGTQLLFDKAGQVKGEEVKGRQYEIPLDDTIPPTGSPVAVTINGVANTAGVKIISNLKIKNGVGQHQGTIDIDIDTIPAGHVTLAYNGSATVVGSTTTSKGTFKTAKTTGIFAGLVAEGTYDMTIVESAQTVGAPVTVTLTTVSP